MSSKVNIDRVVKKFPPECWVTLAALLDRPYPFSYEAKRVMIKDLLFADNYGRMPSN
jgi:hypothetical protein